MSVHCRSQKLWTRLSKDYCIILHFSVPCKCPSAKQFDTPNHSLSLWQSYRSITASLPSLFINKHLGQFQFCVYLNTTTMAILPRLCVAEGSFSKVTFTCITTRLQLPPVYTLTK